MKPYSQLSAAAAKTVLALALLLLVPNLLVSQESIESESEALIDLVESRELEDPPENEEEPEEKRSFLMFGPEDKPKQFLPMPLFIQNPTLGTGFGLAATVMFKTDYDDEDLPYSAVSVPGFYTNTHSYFLATFASLHFLGGDLRIVGGGGYGRVNNEYEYELVTLTQEIGFSLGVLRASYAVIPHLYVGGAYMLNYVDYISFKANGISIPIENAFSSGVYISTEWDNRNSIYNPTAGFYGRLEPGFFPTWLGSDSTYITLDYEFNGYQHIVDPLIFAYRLMGSHAFLDVPYSAYPTLGRGPDLRGYEAGAYRGANLFATQVELRWNFVWKLSLTAFGGIGAFYGENKVPENNVPNWTGVPFPSAGFGISLLTSEETGVVVRFDFAWGKDGDFAWYFQMGNSF